MIISRGGGKCYYYDENDKIWKLYVIGKVKIKSIETQRMTMKYINDSYYKNLIFFNFDNIKYDITTKKFSNITELDYVYEYHANKLYKNIKQYSYILFNNYFMNYLSNDDWIKLLLICKKIILNSFGKKILIVRHYDIYKLLFEIFHKSDIYDNKFIEVEDNIDFINGIKNCDKNNINIILYPKYKHNNSIVDAYYIYGKSKYKVKKINTELFRDFIYSYSVSDYIYIY